MHARAGASSSFPFLFLFPFLSAFNSYSALRRYPTSSDQRPGLEILKYLISNVHTAYGMVLGCNGVF